MILTCDEMKQREEELFARGVTAGELMEAAGEGIARAVMQFFPEPGLASIFFGKGHNGGDALVAARHLQTAGWRLNLKQAADDQELSDLTRAKLQALETGSHGATQPHVILDGLLGIGAKGALRDPIRGMAREINQMRRDENASVFAIDVPTGLDGDTGCADPDCVIADFTLAIGFAKCGLVADEATRFTGRLAVLPLPHLQTSGAAASSGEIATPETLAGLLPRREFTAHKGDFGRIGVVAGSIGLTGAAVMTSHGAVRGGGGLVSLYATHEIHGMLVSAVSPEVMVKPVKSYAELLSSRRDVIAIGPGLGYERREEVLDLIRQCEEPMIIDADGLNILADKMDVLHSCAGPRLLTPHPGEMSRLMKTDGLSRSEMAARFTNEFPVTLLLKGSRTIVAESGRPHSYNSTGTPAMATGGMGDVLTGVCAAMAGSRLPLYDAARLSAWICGRAAELAISHGNRSEESLSATDLFETMGEAFKQLRDHCY
jgi:ADP-dependent NAD(P)H-hydrate dehydratase / NAD(P)H-hydrate epimerase